MQFNLKAPFKPTDAQQKVIDELASGYSKYSMQTLLGLTGSGKTFVMANVINKVQKPTLVLAHNKILAAQLYAELKELFPENRVEYFISYYDYYQPESYVPTTDTFIEKDSSVNEQIERMRLKATASILSRDDVIVVASISCIYGLGDPEDFASMSLELKQGGKLSRNELIGKLVDMQYARNDTAPESGNFRVRGDVIDIVPGYDKNSIRVELFGDEVERITELEAITGNEVTRLDKLKVFPAKQFVVPEEKILKAISSIKDELEEHLPTIEAFEAERLKRRVAYDLEMLEELGFCSGIENYSRHFEARNAGEPPKVLLDYFPDDFMLIIDESHQTLPQSRAMYKGDYARKKNLVDYGFRLPSAIDNRPLKFEEFEKYFHHAVFVSATPGPYELDHSKNISELIVRPTGLLDPLVDVRPIKGQMDDLQKEINAAVKKSERVLVTTLTKRMAEDLTAFLAKQGIKVRYMHSDIDSLERIELIRQLRAGEFDVLVGINLLREGLDIPEVGMVAILDADKSGFLRDERSLIQTIGRAARNVKGRVIMYADEITTSMDAVIKLTRKRRKEQILYNKKHGIVPQSVQKSVPDKERDIKGTKHLAKSDVEKQIIQLEADMKKAAAELEFEKAIEIRDVLNNLKKQV